MNILQHIPSNIESFMFIPLIKSITCEISNKIEFLTDWVLLCSICRINRRTCKNET